MNRNTQEEWDKVWEVEGPNTWRTYPSTFNKICELIPKGSNVLELGCGTGALLYQIQTQCGGEVIGIDLSPVAINWMQTIYELRGHVSEVPPIPEYDNIDVIVASQLLEHMEDPDNLVKQMSQYANMAIIAVPNNTLTPEECTCHYQTFTVETIKNLMYKYYNHVEVYTLTDIFLASNKLRIKIPVIICKCWGTRRE